jgi:hypothetical protein
VPGHPTNVIASMGNGWFALWWPIRAAGDWRLLGLDSAGEVVATVEP